MTGIMSQAVWNLFNTIRTKLGATPTTAPTANTVLRGTGAGTSDWGQVVNGDVAAAAAIAVTKLAAGTAGQKLENVSGTNTWVDPRYCRVYHNANQLIASGSATNLAFNQTRVDRTNATPGTGGMHDNTTNNSRLIAPVAGWYTFSVSLLWAGPAANGNAIVAVVLNGATAIASESKQLTAGNGFGMSITGCYQLAANDYLEVNVAQFTGGAINVTNNANYSPEFSLTLLDRS